MAAEPQRHMLCQLDAPVVSSIFDSASTPEPEDGQVLVHVTKVLVTANTVTYALAGKVPGLMYFDHWPVPKDAPDNHALCPTWGTGVVTVSKCPKVPVGTRLHGFFPFSQRVVITPQVDGTTILDSAEHKEALPTPYRKYLTHDDPSYAGKNADEEDCLMASMTFHSTGWAMAQTAALHPEKPTAVVVTAASSRTSRACAFSAKHHELKLELIGLTSPGNLEYTKGLELFDKVITYSEVADLPKQKVAIMDVAGAPAVIESLYKHFGADIVHTSTVGMADIGAAISSGGQPANLDGLGGPKPEFFLVFDALRVAYDEYGIGEANKMLQECGDKFNEFMQKEFKVERSYGAEATKEVFDNFVQNKADTKTTYIASMWPEALAEPPPVE